MTELAPSLVLSVRGDAHRCGAAWLSRAADPRAFLAEHYADPRWKSASLAEGSATRNFVRLAGAWIETTPPRVEQAA